MRNDYKVICEKKYYVVFTDGQGKEQKIEIPKEVAQVIQGEQTKENTIRRSEERHTVSFDAMDYEGDFFASYDSYELDGEKTELSREEKVRAVLKAMKPRQAELLRLVYLSHYNLVTIAVYLNYDTELDFEIQFDDNRTHVVEFLDAVTEEVKQREVS